MAYFTFTVTQDNYIFTATISNPAQLTLQQTPADVAVTNVLSTVTVSKITQPVTISGLGGGEQYNQSLNTTDNVAFASVTTPQIFGTAGKPVFFPNGISAQNVGSTFVGSWDQGGIFMTFTNQIALLTALSSFDLGTVNQPGPYSVDFGPI